MCYCYDIPFPKMITGKKSFYYKLLVQWFLYNIIRIMQMRLFEFNVEELIGIELSCNSIICIWY